MVGCGLLAGWLAGWLVGWLVGWLIDGRIGRLIDFAATRLMISRSHEVLETSPSTSSSGADSSTSLPPLLKMNQQPHQQQHTRF
jgi:hypothetical protein